MPRGRLPSGHRGATNGERLSEQATAALSALASKSGAIASGDPKRGAAELHRSLVDLFLRTTLLACAEDFGVIEDGATGSWRDGRAEPTRLRERIEKRWSELRRRNGPRWSPGRAAESFLGELDWIDDETLAGVLRNLTTIDGTPVSYRELGVEGLGRVYEGLLGVELESVTGTALCLKPDGVWIRVSEILEQEPDLRAKWIQRAAGMPKTSVQRLAAQLGSAKTELEVIECLDRFRKPSSPIATRGRIVLQHGSGRRRSGSHYTPRALTQPVVSRALSPLVEGRDSRSLLDLAICDPAMGAGAFLVEACRFLSDRLVSAWQAEGVPEADAPDVERRAFREIVEHVVHGVDKNPVAVDLARSILAILSAVPGEPVVDVEARLVVGDALVDRPLGVPSDDTVLVWRDRFPRIFEPPRRGFDAFVGNPPWVAFAGRAAQPIDEELATYFRGRTSAFSGYPTLHGLFVWRTASLLAPGGRLGLVLPTSVSDLAGYAPTRRAHDALCEPDGDLTDFGDGAFAGVFQPCMALTSTRRREMVPVGRNEPCVWAVERPDLDELDRTLLAKLARLPALPAALFGERGFQSTGDDLSHLRSLTAAEPPYTEPIREGSDVAEFCVHPPTLFLDPRRVTGRFRAPADWAKVKVLIRQTARFPIAALSDGLPFRNSILAGFSDRRWSAQALLCYLNSSVVRWFHYFQNRDARQGMPQLKIGHLRSLPDLPPGGSSALDDLDAMGRQVGSRNRGISQTERDELDRLVERGLGLTKTESERVRRFAAEHPPPTSRRRPPRSP